MQPFDLASVVPLLLVGWGVGWFVARSAAGDFLLRSPLAQCREIALRMGKLVDKADSILLLPLGLFFHGLSKAFSFGAGMADCAACTGFWTGIVLGTLNGMTFGASLALGAAVMGVNAVLDAITGAASAKERALWQSGGDGTAE